MTKAWQQGRFDGLCGVYSLINAVNYLDGSFGEEDCGKLFEFIIKAGGTAFPSALYQGLGFMQLWGIAGAVRDHLAPQLTLQLSRPFYRAQEDTLDSYLDTVAGLITGKDAVAIVGLGKPWDHWTVIAEVDPRSVRFHDSYGIKRMKRSALSLTVGEDVTKVDYHQTIIVEKR